MRTAPLLSVEIDGVFVRRSGVLDVLVRDAAGRALVSHLRPQLLAGEVLHERAGLIPMIVLETVCPT